MARISVSLFLPVLPTDKPSSCVVTVHRELTGDLTVTCILPLSYRTTRLGNDLYVTAPLNLYTAVLGGEETVDTLDGKVKLKVKPETQNGTKVRLKGKGFPVYKEEGKFGDLIVTYNITIPTNLTEHQKELFRQLKNSIN